VAALTQDHTDEIVQAAGIRTQVRRGGKGAPLLYIHGELGLPGWIHSLDILARERDVTRAFLAGLWRERAARLDHEHP